MGLRTKKILTASDMELPEIEIKKQKIVVTHTEGQKISDDIEVIEAGRDKDLIFDLEKRKFEKPRGLTSHEMHQGAYGVIEDVTKEKRAGDVIIDLNDPVIPESIEVPEVMHPSIEEDLPEPEVELPSVENAEEEGPPSEDEKTAPEVVEFAEAKPKAEKPEFPAKVEKQKKEAKKEPAKKPSTRRTSTKKESTKKKSEK